MSEGWRRRAFHGRRCTCDGCRVTAGLVPAPRRATPSHELTAARELEARQIAHAARVEHEEAERVRLMHLQGAERRRRQIETDAEAVLAAMTPAQRARAIERFKLDVEE